MGYLSKLIPTVFVVILWLCIFPIKANAMLAITEVDYSLEQRSLHLEVINNSGVSVELKEWQVNGKAQPPASFEPYQLRVINLEEQEFTNEEVRVVVTVADEQEINWAGGGLAFGLSWQSSGPLCQAAALAPTSLGVINTNQLAECWDYAPKVEVGTSSNPIPAGQEFTINLHPYPPVVSAVAFQGSPLAVGNNHLTARYLGEAANFKLEASTLWGLQNYSIPELRIAPGVRLNELLVNPIGDDIKQEWVELDISHSEGLDKSLLQMRINAKPVDIDWQSSLTTESFWQLFFYKAVLPNCSSQPCLVTIELSYGDTILDTFTYTSVKENKSWSKLTNGDWVDTYPLTPGAANLLPHVAKTLRVNELVADPEVGEEWVELFNFGSEAIDLNDWVIKDLTGSHRLQGVLASNAYIVIQPKFSLNNSGDKLQLFYLDELVSYTEYQADVKSFAWAYHAGAERFVITTTPTPGGENTITPPQLKQNNQGPIPRRSSSVLSNLSESVSILNPTAWQPIPRLGAEPEERVEVITFSLRLGVLGLFTVGGLVLALSRGWWFLVWQWWNLAINQPADLYTKHSQSPVRQL